MEEKKQKRMAIIASQGTLDWAYPPFILASTAAAMNYEVSIFFTFYGLTLLKKKIKAKVAPHTNPAMPMKMPFGPGWFQNMAWPIPNVIMGNVPFFENLATGLMKKTFKNKKVMSIPEFRQMCMDMGVKMIGAFCDAVKDTVDMDPKKYIAGFQIIPNEIPGFGPIELNEVKISMRVSAYMEEEIRAGRRMGLDVLLPEATNKLGGFSDACHTLTAATTVSIGKEEELIAEMERILSIDIVK